jgi:hypothetical protein
MIDQSEQTELSEQVVAQKVAEYLKDCHPDGITLEVDRDGVHRGEFSWRVRVRPDREPSKLFEYYGALADVEVELSEREHLNVWLVTSDPKQLGPAREGRQAAECKAPPVRTPKRRLRGTKQLVAQKVVEYLRDAHPEGITLDVEEDRIRKADYWWEVPIRPEVEPRELSEYYEALARVEEALEEREQLKVFLVPSPAPQTDEV